MADREALLSQLDAERGRFLDALDRVDLQLASVPGVQGDWSVRDIVYHLALWCEHAIEAIALAVNGRGDAFDYSTADTDSMNERFLAAGRSVSPDDALAREDEAFTELRRRVEALDPGLLPQRLGNGDTVEEVIVYDGPEHYAEHTAHLRAWFGADEDEPDDDA